MSDEPIISAIHITSRSRFGLSNRIRGLAGYYALPKVLACDLLYSWETDASCPGLIQDVFSAIPVGLPVETHLGHPRDANPNRHGGSQEATGTATIADRRNPCISRHFPA
jgi:hypothetical protein